MSILVVGGDHLGNIPQKLDQLGFTEIRHLKGRRNSDTALNVGKATDVVLVLIDYVSHGITKSVKEQAKNRQVPVVFAKRAWSSIALELQKVVK